jgi:hypothetical protein
MPACLVLTIIGADSPGWSSRCRERSRPTKETGWKAVWHDWPGGLRGSFWLAAASDGAVVQRGHPSAAGLTFRRSRVAFGRNFLMEIVGGSGLAGWFCVDETLGFGLPRVQELLHLTIVRNRGF